MLFGENNRLNQIFMTCLTLLLLNGCATPGKDQLDQQDPSWGTAKWNETSDTHKQLINLPKSSGAMAVSIYSFRDQTGQFKPSPSNNFSTAVLRGQVPF